MPQTELKLVRSKASSKGTTTHRRSVRTEMSGEIPCLDSAIKRHDIAGRPSGPMILLDRIDRKILNALQRNNQMTNLALSDTVGVSPPSCLRRVRRLRTAKVITSDVSLIDPRYAGHRISMVVEIALERERPDLMEGFKRTILEAPEVAQCYVVTGDADFILIIQVRDIEAYDGFVQRVFYSNPNIRKFRTLIVMNRVKAETRIPLQERDVRKVEQEI